MGRVDGKVVLITGGARGMGAAHAEALVSEGARVVIADVLDSEGRGVAEKLGESAHFEHLDVADPDRWEAVVDAATQRFGRLDGLVNNAGIGKVGPLRGSSVSDWATGHRCQPHRGLPRYARRDRTDDRRRRRIDRQYLVGARIGRQRPHA